MDIRFDADLNRWALLLHVEWFSHAVYIEFLCFQICIWRERAEPLTPEEELKFLDEYEAQELQSIAHQRAEIYKAMDK
jgi:hypothetical protein